jgi:hypothetical protein
MIEIIGRIGLCCSVILIFHIEHFDIFATNGNIFETMTYDFHCLRLLSATASKPSARSPALFIIKEQIISSHIRGKEAVQPDLYANTCTPQNRLEKIQL